MPKPARIHVKHANRAASRRKPAKALESAARQVKDSEEFVTHIANIANRYRHEYSTDLGARAREVRQSLRAFHKQAALLREWLQAAQKESNPPPQRDALARIGTVMNGVSSPAFTKAKDVQAWLEQAIEAAEQCIAESARSPRAAETGASRVAAEALRATFEYHKLKLSTKTGKDTQGDGIKLLCAIAKNAGDAGLTPQAARQAFVESGRSKSA